MDGDIARAKSEIHTHNISTVDYQAWRAQYHSAKRRGIEFKFSLYDWCQWWQRELAAKGPNAERGLRKHQYMMCRYGDTGPYAPGNVYCGTCADNFADPAFRKVQTAHWRSFYAEHESHLKGKRGARHPKSRAVITPDGRFESAAAAGEHYGITRQAASVRAKAERFGWQYEQP